LAELDRVEECLSSSLGKNPPFPGGFLLGEIFHFECGKITLSCGMAVSTTSPISIRERFQDLDLESSLKLVFSARKGIKARLFFEFADSINMPEKKLADLINISSRTVHNYKESQKPLDPVQSEHLLKLISLYGKGEDIFGNLEEFNYWLQKPFWKSKEKPLDWLNTPGGVDLVKDELAHLSHGYAV
jgi:putative toxin-antitoxin system antitoxin component (TIGR02293 family)